MSGEKKTLINSVANEFIGIAVQVEDASYRWRSKEVFQLRQCEGKNQRSGENGGETMVDIGVEPHDK